MRKIASVSMSFNTSPTEHVCVGFSTYSAFKPSIHHEKAIRYVEEVLATGSKLQGIVCSSCRSI